MGRQVEDGQVEKIDAAGMGQGKVQGSLGGRFVFGRRAEKQVNIGGDARLVQGLQRHCHHIKVGAFVKGVQHRLITRFDSQLEHPAAGLFQAAHKIKVGQMGGDAGEAVPGNSGRMVGQKTQETRRQGIVQEVNQAGATAGQPRQFRHHPRRWVAR